MSTGLPLKVLILEDRPSDAELILDELRQSGYEPDWKLVDTEVDFLANLDLEPEIILADYSLPQWDAPSALNVLKERGLDIPLIMLSGTVGEDLAVSIIKQGAADYLLKDRLARLGQAVGNALAAKQFREQKRQTEDAIRRLHTAVEQSGNSVVITDLEGNIEYVNPKFTEVTGYTADEVIGQNPRVLKSGETSPQVYKTMWETIASGSIWRGEFHNRKKNGELFWELATISPVKDETGNIINYLAVKEDITKRKQIEAELAQERNLLRTLIDSLPERIYAKDVEGRFMLKNEADVRQIGANSTTEVIGKTDFDYYPAELAERYHGDDQAVIRSGRPLLEHEELVISADGTQGWMLTSKIPLRDNDGNVIGLVGIGRDITERKLAEEQLRRSEADLKQAQQVAHVGSWAWYIQSNHLHWSDEMFRIFDLDKDTFEGDLSEVIASAIHPDDREAVEQSNASVINTGTPIPLEYRIIRADGTVRTVWAEAGELQFDSAGNPAILTGIVQDITVRKESEQQLRKLNRTLALLSDVNQTIVRISTTSTLFEQVCRIAVEQGGFRMAWIGLLDPETAKVNPVASCGIVEDYLENLGVILNDTPQGHGPTARAIQTGKHVIINNINHNSTMIPWRDHALKLGYCAEASFPLIVNGEVQGTFGLYSDQVNFFDDEELKLLDEMASDIAFAMEFAENEAQRRQAEIALKQHVKAVEEMRVFLQTTLDAFPANTVVLNTDGTIINVNNSWIRFADDNGGRSPMHYLSANYLTICDTANGSRSEESAPAAAGIRAVIEGQKETFELEYPCNSPDEERWFQLRVTPFPEDAPRRVVLAHINVTERKQAENGLRNANELLEERVIERTAQLQEAKEHVEAILDNSADAILLVDTDLTIELINSSFNQMFGCDPNEYLGKPLSSLLASSEAENVESFRHIAYLQKKAKIDVNARRMDGTTFAAELNIRLISQNNAVCTFHDISERKEFEHSLQMAITKEQELNELKTRFLSMASHEFRTPLATIYATTETLSVYRQRLTAEKIDQKLDRIRLQVNYLNGIMNDVLDLARLQARRFEFNPDICDIDALCRGIVEEFRTQPNLTHQLLYSCDQTLPATSLDTKLMRQLISNLLSNAIKYSADDEAVVIKLEHSDNTLVLCVQDHGIGIPENDLGHLFEPFHRASNVGTIHGTGLGLIIAKEAIDLHGGRITVESQVGLGTTITVYIPISAIGE